MYANLENDRLNWANLKDTNLKGANLDYSSWTLCCGSTKVTVAVKIARQLMYHAVALLCDDKEFKKLKKLKTVQKFINKFHRIKDCEEIK